MTKAVHMKSGKMLVCFWTPDFKHVDDKGFSQHDKETATKQIWLFDDLHVFLLSERDQAENVNEWFGRQQRKMTFMLNKQR